MDSEPSVVQGILPASGRGAMRADRGYTDLDAAPVGATGTRKRRMDGLGGVGSARSGAGGDRKARGGLHAAPRRAHARARPCPDGRVPTGNGGSTRGRSPGHGRARERRRCRPARRPGEQADRRRDRSDARLQRLDPGPHAHRSRGLRNRRQLRERGRPRGDDPLARAAPGEPLRRDARDTAAGAGRRGLHLPAPVPGPGRVLVPPAHPAGLRTGARPLREHRRRPGRGALLAAGQPRTRR